MEKIKEYLNSTYALYACFLAMYIAVFYTVNPTFRDVEIPVIMKILHPEYYNGEFFNIDINNYNPYFNYNYIVAFIAKSFGYTNNLWELGKIFWIFEKGFAIVTLIMMCNYIFNKDMMVLAVAIPLFISFIDNEATQKSMAMPLYILAIYYFLKEKWHISAIFAASIFYLHIGRATWWLLTASAAFSLMYFVQKRITLKQSFNYLTLVIFLAAPIVFVYIGRAAHSNVEDFTIRYFYYTGLNATSPLLTLTVTPVYFVVQWSLLAFCLIGYYKASKEWCKTDNIMPVVLGAIFFYPVQFVLADIMGNKTAITMQLTRTLMAMNIFGILFLGFLLARQVKKGNYVFLLLSALILFFYKTGITVIALGTALVVYELFENPINDAANVAYSRLKRLINIKASEEGSRHILCYPVVVAVCLLFLFIFPKLQIVKPVKSYVKSLIYHSYGKAEIGQSTVTDKTKAYADVLKYINTGITGNTLFLYPFLKWEFPVYTHHNGFINSFTPTYNLFYNNEPSYRFQEILTGDLGYSLEKLFENWDGKNLYERWDKMWKNLNEDVIMRWRERYNLTHVIRENELPLKCPLVYQNSFYSVYEIK